MEEIPHYLILNWDQTAINYVPIFNWTMAKKGTHKVSIAGIDNKRQITLVLAATMTGKLLPIQLVYQGKTKESLLPVDFPASWDVTFSLNHWCNEITMDSYIRKIICPCIVETRPEGIMLQILIIILFRISLKNCVITLIIMLKIY